ncbi:hypothetical protein IQ37_02365 [Chryseobacterium piperi]|uniref:Uncharacterized protein n=1 Tax=Chryseobacterium piperi TaxID=558152 RepID=A0A086BM62_9FLAO|nr:hypothetical protein [Chryseobacterium piperi]ASW75388.1 hypothetical protein CJF12_14630 [Chryseobacterium piperi]KFF30026.1 hypothetical protein IQ37_02365 [Chryseobacterium piperi]
MKAKGWHSNHLQWDEVYVSDMVVLKDIFLQKQNSGILNEDFGLPFLLAKKAQDVVAFACLVINHLGKIDFILHEVEDLNGDEKKDSNHMRKIIAGETHPGTIMIPCN